MEFSDTHRVTLPPHFSPDGAFLACPVDHRLVVRDAETLLQVARLHSSPFGPLASCAWSPDSRLLLCTSRNRAVIQVLSVYDAEFDARIDEAPAGVSAVLWAPDSRHVLVVADFNLRVAVWSLADRSCAYLAGPKHGADSVAFSGGTRCSVLERRAGRDRLHVYDARTSGWPAACEDLVLETADAAGLSWSPCGRFIAVCDSCLAYKVVVVAVAAAAAPAPAPGGLDAAAADGVHRVLLQPVATYSAYSDALGVKAAAWAPSGRLLAVGSFDHAVRLLDAVTGRPLLTCEHAATVIQPAGVAVYQEVEELVDCSASPDQSPGPGRRNKELRARYALAALPLAVPSRKPLQGVPPASALGVGLLRWCPSGAYLATVDAGMPQAVWVWELATMQLCNVLIHAADVTDVQWSPLPAGGDGREHGNSSAAGAAASGSRLAIATGGAHLYLWSPHGASVVAIPLKGFRAASLAFSAGGSALLLYNPDCFCVAYPTPPQPASAEVTANGPAAWVDDYRASPRQ